MDSLTTERVRFPRADEVKGKITLKSSARVHFFFYPFFSFLAVLCVVFRVHVGNKYETAQNKQTEAVQRPKLPPSGSVPWRETPETADFGTHTPIHTPTHPHPDPRTHTRADTKNQAKFNVKVLEQEHKRWHKTQDPTSYVTP